MTKRRIASWGITIFVVAGIVFFILKNYYSPDSVSLLPPPSTTPTVVPPLPQIPLDPIRYSVLTLSSALPMIELEEAVGKDQVPIVLALNRIDANNLKSGMTLTVLNTPTDMLSLSPFPDTLLAASTLPKIIFISQQNQAFGAYEYGTLVRWGAVSTGKKSTPTPSKLYHTNWKGKLVISTVNSEWLLPWYFNLENFEGISMHQYELPGYPASHSCVRLSKEDAMWIYDWAQQWILAKATGEKLANGTPVIIFGAYDYEKIAPWKMLSVDNDITSITATSLEHELTTYLSEIEKSIEQRNRI